MYKRQLLNAGQTCVAPDYCLVDRKVRDELVEELKKQFQRMLGQDPLANEDVYKRQASPHTTPPEKGVQREEPLPSGVLSPISSQEMGPRLGKPPFPPVPTAWG